MDSFPKKYFFLLVTLLVKYKLNKDFKWQPKLKGPASRILSNLMAIDSSNLMKLD